MRWQLTAMLRSHFNRFFGKKFGSRLVDCNFAARFKNVIRCGCDKL